MGEAWTHTTQVHMEPRKHKCLPPVSRVISSSMLHCLCCLSSPPSPSKKETEETIRSQPKGLHFFILASGGFTIIDQGGNTFNWHFIFVWRQTRKNLSCFDIFFIQGRQRSSLAQNLFARFWFCSGFLHFDLSAHPECLHNRLNVCCSLFDDKSNNLWRLFRDMQKIYFWFWTLFVQIWGFFFTKSLQLQSL